MESDWVAEKVQEDLSSLNNKSVAIIARNRKLLQPIYDKLKDKSIPVVIVQRKNEFESAQVSWLHYILRLANKRNDKKFLNKVVSNFGVLTELNINVEEVVAWSKATDGDYLRGFLNSVRDGALTDHQLLKSLEFDLVEGKDFFRFIQFCFECVTAGI